MEGRVELVDGRDELDRHKGGRKVRAKGTSVSCSVEHWGRRRILRVPGKPCPSSIHILASNKSTYDAQALTCHEQGGSRGHVTDEEEGRHHHCTSHGKDDEYGIGDTEVLHRARRAGVCRAADHRSCGDAEGEGYDQDDAQQTQYLLLTLVRVLDPLFVLSHDSPVEVGRFKTCGGREGHCAVRQQTAI